MHRVLIVLVTAFLVTVSAATASAEIVSIDGTVKSVDAKKRTITVETGTKEMTLDVGSKAKISIDGESLGLDSLKSGQAVSLSYHDQLEVVVKIESKTFPTAKGQDWTILNLEELNSSDNDSSPCLSLDGLELFWVSGGPSDADLSIWSAKRKDPESLFSQKKRLFAGHAPVLSANGLELYFRSATDSAVSQAIREQRSDDFGRPSVIQSLKSPQETDPAPRWLTVDGLTMYLDYRMLDNTGKMRHHTVTSTRKSLADQWAPPILVKIAFDGMSKDFRISQVSATLDNLHLFCIAQFTSSDRENCWRLGMLSRSQPHGEFTQWTELPLTAPNGKYPMCFKPQFVAATKELFLGSKNFYSNPESARHRKEDLWVIKNFQPPVAVSDEGLQFPLDGHWKLIDGDLGDGQKLADGRTLAIKGNKYKLTMPSRRIEGIILIDPTEAPKHLTWIAEMGGSTEWKGKRQPGIWELTENGTVFRFISGAPEAARPTDFRPKPGYPVQAFKRIDP